MSAELVTVDVLCVGSAAYDLIFALEHHPRDDEKTVTDTFYRCGGGPAANAAVAVSRLGLTAAFYGYLGNDPFGDLHLDELKSERVDTTLLCRGDTPTPLSVVLVKPDGRRALINHNSHQGIATLREDFRAICQPGVLLFDGWEPEVSIRLLQEIRGLGIPTILDAGSVHRGTRALVSQVDYLVCSEKFAIDYAGVRSPEQALDYLSELGNTIVITCGEAGLLWQNNGRRGAMQAFQVEAVDTTGAGDAFHGAFAAAVRKNMAWPALLRYASAVAALCCTKIGARSGLPSKSEVATFLAVNSDEIIQ